ncbi:MAG TPA: ABC transporter substrate-binding protein [Candidatus Binatia bacterium]
MVSRRNVKFMMTISLRVLVLSVSLILLASVQSNGQTSLQRIRIAYSSTGVNYVDLFLGKEKGYFREEGLEPQLIQMSSNIAITANIAGELDGQAAIGSAIRAIQRGAPLRVVVVTLRRPLFWLVVRPEYRAIKELKGKVLGISTIGGSQHLRAKGMLAAGGLDAERGCYLDSNQRSDHAAASIGEQLGSNHGAQSALGCGGARQIQDEHT